MMTLQNALYSRTMTTGDGYRWFSPLKNYQRRPYKIDAETYFITSACVVLTALMIKAFSKNIFVGLGLLVITAACLERFAEKCLEIYQRAEFENVHLKNLAESREDAKSLGQFIEENLCSLLDKRGCYYKENVFNSVTFNSLDTDSYKNTWRLSIRRFCKILNRGEAIKYSREMNLLLRKVNCLRESFKNKYSFYICLNSFFYSFYRNDGFTENKIRKCAYRALGEDYKDVYNRKYLKKDVKLLAQCLFITMNHVSNMDIIINNDVIFYKFYDGLIPSITKLFKEIFILQRAKPKQIL